MSAEYLALMAHRQEDVMRAYFQAARECESSARASSAAALCIQRRWRGYRDRAYLRLLHDRALSIQRVYRGHAGRQRFQEALQAREHAAMASHFGAMATRIQALARGRASRRATQDVYARRAYIAQVGEAGSALLAASDAAHERQVLSLAQAAADRRSAAFESLVVDAHHLLSTRAQPGVFKAPLGGVAGGTVDATAFDVPVETHIREAFVNRQTQLRQMRKTVFTPAPPAQPFIASAPTAAAPAPAVAAHFSPFRADSPSSSVAGLASSSYAVSTSSARGSSAGSRHSRPTSAGRLAPLQQPQQQQQPHYSLPSSITASPASSPHAHTQGRSFTSHSISSVTSSAAGGMLDHTLRRGEVQQAQHQHSSHSSSAQKLPSLRGTPSGRTIDAQQLYDSKMFSTRDEEKQQLPLALAAGGHVSVAPTPVPSPPGARGRLQQAQQASSLAATRNFASPAKVKAAPAPVPLRAGL